MPDGTPRRALLRSMAVLALALMPPLWSSARATAQSGPAGPDTSPLPSCTPGDVNAPCPSVSPDHPPLSGTISWSDIQDDPGGLGSGVTWASSITLDMVWHEAERLYVPRTGTYHYDHELTGHCTGSVSGSGALSTEPYAGPEPGIATVTAEAFPPAPDNVLVKVRIWRDDYTQHCAATPGFDAFDTLDPGSAVQPICTRVLGTPGGGPPTSYSLSCVEQQIPGVHDTVSGVLQQVP